MPLDPIGPRPAGMEHLDNLDPTRIDDVKGGEFPKSPVREPAIQDAVEQQTVFPKREETASERLGEAKFQGMMVRENLLSGAHDPSLSNRLAKGVEVQDRLNLGAAEPALAHQLGDVKGKSQDKSHFGVAKPALAQPAGQLSEAGAVRESSGAWAERFEKGVDLHGKAAQAGELTIQDKFWQVDHPFVKGEHLDKDAKNLSISENLRESASPNIWGERLGGAAENQAGLDVQEHLHSGQANVTEYKTMPGEPRVAVQGQLRTAEPVVSMIGSQLEGIDRSKGSSLPAADKDLQASPNLRQAERSNIWSERLESAADRRAELGVQDKLQSHAPASFTDKGQIEDRAATQADLEVRENLNLDGRSWAGVGARPKVDSGG